MASAHTPGPWLAEEHVIVTEDGQQVASVLPFYDEREAESLADARLISAAPELLAALQAVLAADELDPRTWPSMCAASIATADAFAAARAAITKATEG